MRLTKRALGFDENRSFFVPEEVSALFADRADTMHRVSSRWQREFKEWTHATRAGHRLEPPHQGELPEQLKPPCRSSTSTSRWLPVPPPAR